MQIIDTHQHAFWHGRDDHGLVQDMDEHRIDSAWLLSWEMLPFEDNGSFHNVLNPTHFRPDGTHRGIPLSDLITARDHYPNRFVLGYCPHPLSRNAPDLFEAAYNMHGVRVCGEWKFRMPFDDPRCIELFRLAGKLKCPVVFHLDVPYRPNTPTVRTYRQDWYGGTINHVERVLASCPQTIFIGHASGFWREICGNADQEEVTRPRGAVQPGGRLIKLLDQYPNLWADLSAGSGLNALDRDHGFATEFLTRYTDRLLFGRDYYGGDLQQLLSTLSLPDGVLQQICCDNALMLVPESITPVQEAIATPARHPARVV